jgi:hypothetical protein
VPSESNQELEMKATLVASFAPLTVVRLGKTDWRVSSGPDPVDLLGYIERQRGGRFEIVWMTDPIRWGYAESFDEALLAFGDAARFSGETADRRARVVGAQHESLLAPAKRTSWIKPNRRSSVA